MSWGKKIIIVFILFILGMSAMMYKSMTKNIDLVSENYYENELKYQEQINKIKNTGALTENLKIETTKDAVVIIYPFENKNITGEISFYRPSEAKFDFSVEINRVEGSKQFINTENLQKGFWKVKVNWTMDGKNYYSEEKIMIQ